MPDLEDAIWQKYREQGVLVYAIYSNETAQQLADFVEQTGITFPVIQDQSTLGLFAYPRGVGYPYPRDVVIGKDLTVRSIKNSFNIDDLDSLVQQLLAE